MKYKKYAIIIASLAFAAFFTGCASNGMNITPKDPSGNWEKEVINSNNTDTHFRATGYGVASDRNTARKYAFNAACSSLSSKVRTIMEVHTSSEANRTKTKIREDENIVETVEEVNKFNEITKSVVAELIKNVNEYATTVQPTDKGELEYCIGVEMARKDVADEMLKVIDKDSKIDSAKKESLKAKALALAAKNTK